MENGAAPQMLAGPAIQSPVDGATIDLSRGDSAWASLVMTARGRGAALAVAGEREADRDSAVPGDRRNGRRMAAAPHGSRSSTGLAEAPARTSG